MTPSTGNGWFPRLAADGRIVCGNTEVFVGEALLGQPGTWKSLGPGGGASWLRDDLILFGRGNGTVLSSLDGTEQADIPKGYNTKVSAEQGRWIGMVAVEGQHPDEYLDTVLVKTWTGNDLWVQSMSPDGSRVTHVDRSSQKIKTLFLNGVAVETAEIMSSSVSDLSLCWLLATSTYGRAVHGLRNGVIEDWSLYTWEGPQVVDAPDGPWVASIVGGGPNPQTAGLLLRPAGSVMGYRLLGDYFYPHVRWIAKYQQFCIVSSSGAGVLQTAWIDPTVARINLRPDPPFGPLSPPEPEGTIVDLGAAFFGDPTPHPRSGPSHAMNQVRDGKKVHMVKFGNPDAYETWELDSWGIHALEDRSNPPRTQTATDTRFFPRYMKVGIAHAFTTPRHHAVWRTSQCVETSRDPFIRRVWVEASYAHYWCGPDRQDRPVKVVCYDPSDGVHEWDDATNTGRGVELYFADGTWSWWELHRSDRVFAAGNMSPVFNAETLVQRSSFYLYGGEDTQPKLSGCATVISVLPYPLAVTITDYPVSGTAPMTISVAYAVTHATGTATTHLMINGVEAASSNALTGTLTTILTTPGVYDLAAITVDTVMTAKTGKIRTITVERPPMQIPQFPTATLIRFAEAYPPPHENGGGQAHEDRCRTWMYCFAQEMRAQHGAAHGTKSAGIGRPQTKDFAAYSDGVLLGGWDVLSGAGTGTPVLITNPVWKDITGQDFIPVPPLSRLKRVSAHSKVLPSRWVGASSFDLGAKIAAGDKRWLTETKSFHVPRVMVSRQSGPTPRSLAEGRAQLAVMLPLLIANGQMANISLLCDTKAYDRATMSDHVAKCNTILLAHNIAVALVELANEIGHPSQNPDLQDIVYAESLAALIDPQFPLAWGGEFEGGSVVTLHLARNKTPEENGAYMTARQQRAEKPCIDDESIGIDEVAVPGRRVNDPTYAQRQAKEGKKGNYRVTLHLDSGLEANVDTLDSVERQAMSLFLAEYAGAPPPVPDDILDTDLRKTPLALSDAGYNLIVFRRADVEAEARRWYTKSMGHPPADSDVAMMVYVRGVAERDVWCTFRRAWESDWKGGAK